jgi:hypothetical protein
MLVGRTIAVKLVLCLRNPVQVARSLNAREGLDRETGEYRWLVHMVDFFRYTSSVKRRDNQLHRARVLEVRIQSPPAASHANFLPHLAEP